MLLCIDITTYLSYHLYTVHRSTILSVFTLEHNMAELNAMGGIPTEVPGDNSQLVDIRLLAG
jgi:hypothetical protein